MRHSKPKGGATDRPSRDWPLLTSLLTGSIPGIIVGSYMAVLVPDTILRPILAATLVAVGTKLVF